MSSLVQDWPIYAGALGVLVGFLFVLIYLYRRIRRLIGKASSKASAPPGLWAGLRNLVLIFLWISVSGMILFMGFFFRAYHAFTYGKPVARIVTQAGESGATSLLTLTQFGPDKAEISERYVVSGDQWMLEGDILKWANGLNFLGWHTRYRLTRLRSRYIEAKDEISREATVFSLVENEDHPFWRYLYRFGHKSPLVNTVYGNSVYQMSREDGRFLVYVGTSGFIVRREETRR
ncbi:MAG: hypothetical protein SCM96_04980 [Acidobacteriota bacterium]|nr:hypothetical protein [Acidobacteriota bacterium]